MFVAISHGNATKVIFVAFNLRIHEGNFERFKAQIFKFYLYKFALKH